MRVATVLSAAVVFLSVSVSLAQVSFTRVALRGDPVPGGGANDSLWGIDFPQINNAGQVGFAAALIVDNTIGGDNGVFLWQPSGLHLLAQRSSVAPGTGGATYDYLSYQPTLGDGGHVGINATLKGAGVTNDNRQGTWVGTTAGVTLLARTGTAAPQFPGSTVEGVGSVRVTEAGLNVISMAVADPAAPNGHSAGVWFGPSNDLQLVFRMGGAAPDAPAGTIVNGYHRLASSENGKLALAATITEPSQPYYQAIFAGSADDLKMAAYRDAPGANAEFSFFEQPVINRSGTVAFNARLVGADVDDSNDEGIWVGAPGALQLVARIGQDAPGTPAGTKFSANDHLREDQWDPLSDPTINSSGQIAFRARFDGAADETNNWGIYAGAPGDLRLIARSGDVAPGIAGAHFKGSIVGAEWMSSFQSPIINDAGEVAFLANVEGAGIEDNQDQAIYATDMAGALHLIVREGQMFDVGGGDVRRVSSVGFTSYDDSITGSSSFNAQGQLVFYLSFEDASNGIFIATVPEPGLGLAVVVLAGLYLRRRARQ
jgi:hypothetical protein